jgi:hypothetical protein
MKITAILNTHGVPKITLDTLDSIRYHMTDQILVVIDGVAWNTYTAIDLPAYKLKGFNHDWYKSPYRNIFLGLYTAAKNWPDSDWFCYIEYDCLVGSPNFKKDLIEAANEGIWCFGNDYQGKFEEVVYLLGACIFYHKDFMKVMLEKEMFQRFLFYTNSFQRGFFPLYDAWDLTEHALPTMVKHFGGKIKQFAAYNQHTGVWAGNYRKYPVRFRPELTYEEQYFLQASIMHPIKNVDDPIRKYHRAKRNARGKPKELCF